MVDQALELGRKDRVDVIPLDREIVGGFPVELGLVGGLSHVPFLGLVLLLIRCVCARLVILEVTNEPGVDTDRAGNDAHDVLSDTGGKGTWKPVITSWEHCEDRFTVLRLFLLRTI